MDYAVRKSFSRQRTRRIKLQAFPPAVLEGQEPSSSCRRHSSLKDTEDGNQTPRTT